MMKKKQLITANALVEFMLVVPVFLALVGGLINTSILLYDKTIITHASREGARYGVVIRTGGYAAIEEIQAYTITYCGNKLISFSGAPGVTVSAVPSVEEPGLGDTLSVTVNYPFSGLDFFLDLGQQYNLSSTTVMSYE